jgi:hypothetical protein
MTATDSRRCHSLEAIAARGEALGEQMKADPMTQPEAQAIAPLLRPYQQETSGSEETQPAA